MTLSFNVTVAVVLPDVPVTVNVALPADAVLLAVKVSTLLVVLLVGLNAAVTPLGNAEIVKITEPVKPPDGVTLIVLVTPAPPGVIESVAGDADNVNPPPVDPATVRLTFVLFVKLPDVPVTVIE